MKIKPRKKLIAKDGSALTVNDFYFDTSTRKFHVSYKLYAFVGYVKGTKKKAYTTYNYKDVHEADFAKIVNRFLLNLHEEYDIPSNTADVDKIIELLK